MTCSPPAATGAMWSRFASSGTSSRPVIAHRKHCSSTSRRIRLAVGRSLAPNSSPLSTAMSLPSDLSSLATSASPVDSYRRTPSAPRIGEPVSMPLPHIAGSLHSVRSRTPRGLYVGFVAEGATAEKHESERSGVGCGIHRREAMALVFHSTAPFFPCVRWRRRLPSCALIRPTNENLQRSTPC